MKEKHILNTLKNELEEVIEKAVKEKNEFNKAVIKTLEEKGIGRPSTYAPTITTILTRRYIEKVQKQLVPTDLGRVVNNLLIENFGNIINTTIASRPMASVGISIVVITFA